ncbi:MAG: class I SAM-dependent methyltransferase [Rickettsiales bacterium]|nr:class I SAM-dependent methyltransferase [Rickettsiales bacterium]
MTRPNASSLKAVPHEDTRKVVLHLGWMSAHTGKLAQQFPETQWREVRYDCDQRVQPDILGRLDRLDAIPEGFADVVYAPQLLQRFPLPAISGMLKEMLRVLKDEGRMALSVPNAQIAAVYVANNQPFQPLYETKVGPISAMDLLYGLRGGVAQGEVHFQHRSGFTYEQLGVLMRDCGFTNISVTRKGYEINAIGFKYPYGHPERVERLMMGGPSDVESKVSAPKPPTGGNDANTATNIPVLRGANGRADELDIPPGMWKPLGLKH